MADAGGVEGYAGIVTWPGLASGLVQTDVLRRAQGRWLDAAGLGPQETPYRTVAAGPGWRLRRYGAEPQTGDAAGPVLLIVPAPIKRAYIWDLCPRVSVVRAALAAGLRVYLLEWVEAAGHDLGLHACAGRLIPDVAARAAADASMPGVLVAGHSLGGTLAAVAAAAEPSAMRALVLLEAPLRFGEAAGAFAPWVAAAPDAERIAALLGDVPGAFLDAAVAVMAPQPFLWARRCDAAASLGDPRRRWTRTCVWRVGAWTSSPCPAACSST